MLSSTKGEKSSNSTRALVHELNDNSVVLVKIVYGFDFLP